jgi:hypothetical protein
MRRLGLVLCVLVGVLIVQAGIAQADPCSGHRSDGDVSSVTYRCHDASGGHTSGGGTGHGGASYIYLWLPACPNSLPGQPGAEKVDCRNAHTCTDPHLLLMALYSRQLTDPNGGPVQRGWHYEGSACRDPSSGPISRRRGLTWAEVRSALERVGPDGSAVQGPSFTLVNLRTTFFAHALSLDLHLMVLGYPVHATVDPISYIWHWGDGTTTTTPTGGRPYPAKDVTHAWRRHTAPLDPMVLSVDVTYTASYQVSDGPWTQIPLDLLVRGPLRHLPIKQASAVLVPGR